MFKKSKFIAWVLVFTLSFLSSNIVSASGMYYVEEGPKNCEESSTLEEASTPPGRSARIGGSGIYYTEETISNTVVKTNSFLGWHPDFANSRRASGYYFSSRPSSTSLSISLGYKFISASVNYDPSSSSGYYVSANYNSWSRPAIYGNVVERKYYSGYKTSNGQWTNPPTLRYSYKTTNSYVKILL